MGGKKRFGLLTCLKTNHNCLGWHWSDAMTVPLQNSVRGNLVYMWGVELCEQVSLRVTCQFQLLGCPLAVVSCSDGGN